MPQTIRIRRSTTASAIPSSLLTGEIAINEADGVIYYRNSSGVVTEYRSRLADSSVTYAKCAPYTVTTYSSQSLSTLLGNLVLVNAVGPVPVTITVPANATTAIEVGRRIDFVQTGGAQITFSGASGVTVNGTPGLRTRTQYSGCTLIKTATDTWVVIGDLMA